MQQHWEDRVSESGDGGTFKTPYEQADRSRWDNKIELVAVWDWRDWEERWVNLELSFRVWC